VTTSEREDWIWDSFRGKLRRKSVDELKTFFFSPTEWVSYLGQADGKIKEKQELLDTLERERQKTAQEMEKVFKLYMSDHISPEGFGRQNKPLEERAKQLEEEIPQLQGEIDFLKIHYLSSDQILTKARDLYSRWPDLKPEERRKIVENITERIVIGKDDVRLRCPFDAISEGEGRYANSICVHHYQLGKATNRTRNTVHGPYHPIPWIHTVPHGWCPS
jgi:site-specific DNA recombinase